MVKCVLLNTETKLQSTVLELPTKIAATGMKWEENPKVMKISCWKGIPTQFAGFLLQRKPASGKWKVLGPICLPRGVTSQKQDMTVMNEVIHINTCQHDSFIPFFCFALISFVIKNDRRRVEHKLKHEFSPN